MAEETLDSLRERVRTLESELRDVRDEAASRRTKNRELKEERDEAARERDTLRGQNEDLARRVNAQPAELQAKVDELTGQLRDVNHKAAFREVALKGGARPEAVDDLYALSGYRPEADDADPAALEALVADQKAKRSLFFAEPAGASTTPAPGAPPPGSGKGKLPPPNTFRVTQMQLADPAWKFANQKALADAHASGSLVIDVPGAIHQS